MRKLLFFAFCIYMLGAFLDLYFTYSCSAGVEEIIALEQNELLVQLLKKGFPFWLAGPASKFFQFLIVLFILLSATIKSDKRSVVILGSLSLTVLGLRTTSAGYVWCNESFIAVFNFLAVLSLIAMFSFALLLFSKIIFDDKR